MLFRSENTWYNMNRDLDDLADFAGIEKEKVRKSGIYKTNRGKLRMFIPTEPMYVDLNSRNHAVVANMQQHGIEVAREVLKNEPIKI
mgnify:CR=1 FL=1